MIDFNRKLSIQIESGYKSDFISCDAILRPAPVAVCYTGDTTTPHVCGVIIV